MSSERRLQCGDRSYVIRRHSDGVVGVYDAEGFLQLGWPATDAIPPEAFDELDDAAWCRMIARLRSGR